MVNGKHHSTRKSANYLSSPKKPKSTNSSLEAVHAWQYFCNYSKKQVQDAEKSGNSNWGDIDFESKVVNITPEKGQQPKSNSP